MTAADDAIAHVPELDLRAPFPWFGGKSRAASLIWNALGNVANYVEPFAGSLAVLLGRPHAPRTETVNDLDCYLANFWRAVAAAPDETASYADYPVNEADLSARHLWLVNQEAFRERMKTDPDFFDAKIAGWWAWGLCQWIGSGWCSLGDAGRGVHRQLPHLGDAGMGVHAARHLDFNALSTRLRRVRVACGDWPRVLGDSVTIKHGITGVLLDPPYADTAKRSKNLYSQDSLTVAHQVREWAVANGDREGMRIVLCGYEGEHAMPASWRMVEWKARGGYGSQNASGNDNAAKERLWMSPHCLGVKQLGLFGGDA